MVEHGVGHSPQTRSFAPAAPLARVRLQNFCFRKRPSFLVSRRFAKGIPDTIFSIIIKGMSQWVYFNSSFIANFLPAIKYSFKEKANFCLLPYLFQSSVFLSFNLHIRFLFCRRLSPSLYDILPDPYYLKVARSAFTLLNWS